MPERMQKTTPFKEGQNSITHGKDAPKAKVFSDVSRSKFGPGHDPLMQSISSGIPDLPNRYHMGDTHVHIHAGGVAYRPDQEFGTIRGKATPATSMKSHTNKPGENAVGKNSNRKGGNALGKAMNKVGTNVLGKPSNKRGAHA